VTFKPGQEVFKRNFAQNNFGKSFNVKFARKFIVCWICKPAGANRILFPGPKGEIKIPPKGLDRGGTNLQEWQVLGRETGRGAMFPSDKWGLQNLGNPGGMSAKLFILRVEHLQRHFGMPWVELLWDFHRLLVNNASEWYWLLICTKQPRKSSGADETLGISCPVYTLEHLHDVCREAGIALMAEWEEWRKSGT